MIQITLVLLWIVLRSEVKYGHEEEKKVIKIQTINLDATQFVPAPPEEVRTCSRTRYIKSLLVEVRRELKVRFLDRLSLQILLGLLNDNDDMQIRCSRGIFTPSNKRKGVKGTSGSRNSKEKHLGSYIQS